MSGGQANLVLADVNIKGVKVQIVRGDITREEVDAIVNAANSHLAHGGGVAAAIVKAGGRIIQEESDRLVREQGPVPTGGAVATTAGSLKAKYVIHAVGPVWRGGNHSEGELLRKAVTSALKLADELKLNSIALPAISLGIFGFPKDLGAQIILDTIFDITGELENLKLIRVVLYSEDMAQLFKNVFEKLYTKRCQVQ